MIAEVIRRSFYRIHPHMLGDALRVVVRSWWMWCPVPMADKILHRWAAGEPQSSFEER